VVATPIGNRDDLSPRARQILREVDLIAAEDTRHTGRLLSHFGIKTPQIALHEHNEERVVGELVARLTSGTSIGLVSDAGTPLISDPGFRLLDAAHTAAIRVSPVPGPSAVLGALSVAGLPTDRFCFEGFLPARAAARRTALAALAAEPRTLVFLESVHKVGATLPDLVAAFGADRAAFIGREMTKLHEQCVRAPLGELADRLATGDITGKGEFVLVIAGCPASAGAEDDGLLRKLLTELADALPGSQAVDIVARATGRRRNEVYDTMLALRKTKDPR
jgi:16S rRNA (cytidine1402-2'-O)-methyltransferase